MSDTEFKDKFIAFVDILGFKKLVEAAETGTGMPLSNLLEALKEFGTPEDRKTYEQYGPRVCPAYGKESQVTAFKREANERGTPFVEVDSVVCDYVGNYGDSCVQEMFARYVKTDGEVTALFPFQRLAHSFIIAGFGHTFDPEQEKQSNQNVRLMITNLKERVMELVDPSNSSAVSKGEHYIAALNAQLKVCARTDEMIDMLCSPLPPRRGTQG